MTGYPRVCMPASAETARFTGAPMEPGIDGKVSLSPSPHLVAPHSSLFAMKRGLF